MEGGGIQLDVSGRLGTRGSVDTPPTLSGIGGDIGTISELVLGTTSAGTQSAIIQHLATLPSYENTANWRCRHSKCVPVPDELGFAPCGLTA